MLRRFHPGWIRRQAYLPEALRPCVCDGLVRVGNGGDGGYVVDRRSISEAQFLLSGGIDVDWTFEADFLKARPVPLFAYDASVGESGFAERRRRGPALFQKRPDYDRIESEFRDFFVGQKVHVAKYIGNSHKENHVDVRGIFSGPLAGFGPGFAKLDIEGSEYEILDQLVECAPRLTGLVVEFHDLPVHLEAVCKFASALPLRVCHVHINNWGALSWSRVPQVIEMSFSRYCGDKKSPLALPLPMDKPCDPAAPDFRLEFR